MATVYVYDKNNVLLGRKENVNLDSYELADNESAERPLTVYEYDDSYRLTGLAKIKPGTMIANATSTVPPDGLNEPTYDPLKNSWYGISDEDAQYSGQHTGRVSKADQCTDTTGFPADSESKSTRKE